MKWSDKSNSFRGMEQRETVFITVVYIITMFFLMSHKWQKKKKERNTSQFFTNNAMLHRYTARSIHVYSFKKISRDTSQRSSKNRLVRAKFFYKKLRILLCVAVCDIRELSRRTSQLLARNIPAGIYFFH